MTKSNWVCIEFLFYFFISLIVTIDCLQILKTYETLKKNSFWKSFSSLRYTTRAHISGLLSMFGWMSWQHIPCLRSDRLLHNSRPKRRINRQNIFGNHFCHQIYRKWFSSENRFDSHIADQIWVTSSTYSHWKQISNRIIQKDFV